MAVQKLSFVVPKEYKDQRIDRSLVPLLSERLKRTISQSFSRKLIQVGAVYLNGRRNQIASKTLRLGARIDVFINWDLVHAGPAIRRDPYVLPQEAVLYEDEGLILVNKPAGIPTQPTVDQSRTHLLGAVQEFVRARSGVTAAPYVALHHRLDRDTSGVILFCKERAWNKAVSELFSQHQIQKTYLAIAKCGVGGRDAQEVVGREWTIEDHLRKTAARDNRAPRMEVVRSGGDFARTQFKIVKLMGRGRCLIEARPETGRMHQIRIHLRESGLPILGDPMYGVREGADRVMLHAARLEFIHPMSKKEIVVEAPLPQDFV